MGMFRKKHDISDIYGVRNEANRLDDSSVGQKHSKSYHNFFRGYTEVKRINAKGHEVTERYYTKPWIVSGLPSLHYWLIRLLYILLTVAAVMLYVTAMTRDIPGTHHWIVAIPGMPTVIVLFLQAVVTIQYLTVPRKMTLWDHASSTSHIKYTSVTAAVIQGLTAVTLVFFAGVTQQEVMQTLLCALNVILASACSAAIFLLERRMPYTEIPNYTKLPEGEAYEIR